VGCVLAIDAGTTGVRTLAIDESGAVVDVAYRELTQYFPRPGWVEHDPAEIWRHVVDTVSEVASRQLASGHAIAAIGVTNQRETVVAWDRATGTPLHRAIVWQDRRTADVCDRLRDDGHLSTVRERTGLVLDPYFSATKMGWLLDSGAVPATPEVVMATVDSWVVWNLTGGPRGGVLATDPTNASRTLLFDIHELRWSSELCELFGVPPHVLPEVHPSAGRIGTVGTAVAGGALGGVPVSGIAGDQQAALFGQACFEPGMAKVTYGTGSFVLLNVGGSCPAPAAGLLTTVAWDLGHSAPGGTATSVTYALEGAVFITGAAIQWLRDGLGLIAQAADLEPLAEQVDDSGGLVLVPAFTGLGSPWWDPRARGTLVGISRGTGAAHLARAAVEAIAFQVRDVIDAMAGAGGRPVDTLRADGGASVMNLLLQLQADQLRCPVARAANPDTTALGVAMLAGLAEGVWSSLEDLAALWTPGAELTPATPADIADASYGAWRRAVTRAMGWAAPTAG